jgi:hypothetical protein
MMHEAAIPRIIILALSSIYFQLKTVEFNINIIPVKYAEYCMHLLCILEFSAKTVIANNIETKPIMKPKTNRD